ncbi:hypothetical protein AB0L41_41425 [Amycolatopsis mediterranei]
MSGGCSVHATTLLDSDQICKLGTRMLAPWARYGEIVDMVADLAKS